MWISFEPQSPSTDFDLGNEAAKLDCFGPVLLLGAPGVGKGTQAEILSEVSRVPKISTGEILRANVSGRTALGRHAIKIMDSGSLVPDHVINEMVRMRLQLHDTSRGFILDGFPRTVGQAQWLTDYLRATRECDSLRIVNLRMDHQQIIQRITHRRICPICKAVYNIELKPPKQAGRCDKDDTRLEQRTDDRMEVLCARLETYRKETEPLLDYFRRYDGLIEVDAGRSISSVTRDIVCGLSSVRCKKTKEISELLP